jgi:hypothetical protein
VIRGIECNERLKNFVTFFCTNVTSEKTHQSATISPSTRINCLHLSYHQPQQKDIYLLLFVFRKKTEKVFGFFWQQKNIQFVAFVLAHSLTFSSFRRKLERKEDKYVSPMTNCNFKQTDRQAGRQTNKQTSTQAHKQTNKQINKQTNVHSVERKIKKSLDK